MTIVTTPASHTEESGLLAAAATVAQMKTQGFSHVVSIKSPLDYSTCNPTGIRDNTFLSFSTPQDLRQLNQESQMSHFDIGLWAELSYV